MNLKEIYEKELVDAKTQNIDMNVFSSKPIMVTGILSPESSLEVQAFFGFTFSLDKKGMEKVIEKFETEMNKCSEMEKKNLLTLLYYIHNVIENYFGGRGIHNKRQEAYFNAQKGVLNLSDIEGKQVGVCAERSMVGHQLLSLLSAEGDINYNSHIANSFLTVNGEREPHSFIILKHKEEDKQFLFDIENPVQYQNGEEIVSGVALYSMTEAEYKDFLAGKVISPESIYEKFGMTLIGDKRYYGNGEIPIETSKPVEEEIDI